MAVCAILLAAGSSRRMGSVNKLTASVEGVPMVVRAARTLITGGVQRIIVVTGFECEAVRAVLINDELHRGEERRPPNSRIEIVENNNYALGMGTSLARGALHIPAFCTGIMVALGDMPSISSTTIETLIERHRHTPNAALAPNYQGVRGHPVLFPASSISQLTALRGDRGARSVYRTQSECIEIEVDDSGVLTDMDTPLDLVRTSEHDA